LRIQRGSFFDPSLLPLPQVLLKDDGFFPLAPSLYVQKKEIERLLSENLECVKPIYFWHTRPSPPGLAKRPAMRTGIPAADKGYGFRIADL
jgi:hypothetical protein